MSLLKRLMSGTKAPVEGAIGYLGLADWWLEAFTEQERDYIEATYTPMGSSPDEHPLTRGQLSFHSGTATNFLSTLAGWFHRPEDRYIALRLLLKAEELAGPNDVLDLHFTYHAMIETYYRDRDSDPDALEAAITACEKQIALAPRAARAFKTWFKSQFNTTALPAHVGYQQLAIIREKQRDYAEVIRLCRAAQQQEWAGDWEGRLARCKKKAVKLQ